MAHMCPAQTTSIACTSLRPRPEESLAAETMSSSGCERVQRHSCSADKRKERNASLCMRNGGRRSMHASQRTQQQCCAGCDGRVVDVAEMRAEWAGAAMVQHRCCSHAIQTRPELTHLRCGAAAGEAMCKHHERRGGQHVCNTLPRTPVRDSYGLVVHRETSQAPVPSRSRLMCLACFMRVTHRGGACTAYVQGRVMPSAGTRISTSRPRDVYNALSSTHQGQRYKVEGVEREERRCTRGGAPSEHRPETSIPFRAASRLHFGSSSGGEYTDNHALRRDGV